MSNLNKKPKINTLFRLQFEKGQNAFVLLYPEGMIKLNDTAATILQYCDGSNSLNDIIASLKQRFAQAPGIEDDVIAFIDEAREKQWIK